MSTVSVIIPTAGSRCTLVAAVESALGQTHKPVEVIVVADGVEAMYAAGDLLAALLEDAFPVLRLVSTDSRLGPAAARNRGVHEAVGSLIAFLDDDDLWMSRKLEAQHDALTAAGATRNLCFTRCLIRADHGTFMMPDHLPASQEDLAEYLFGDPIRLIRSVAYVATPSVMVARGVLLSVPFDETLLTMEDIDWMLRAQRHLDLSIVYLPESLTLVEGRQPARRGSLSMKRDKSDRSLLDWADRRLSPRHAANFKATHWSRKLFRSGRSREAFTDYVTVLVRHPHVIRYLPVWLTLWLSSVAFRSPASAMFRAIRQVARGKVLTQCGVISS